MSGKDAGESRWKERADEAEDELKSAEGGKAKGTIFPSAARRLAAALLLSFILVFSIALFFIILSEAGTGRRSEYQMDELLHQLDGSSWRTDRKGRESFLSAFGSETDGTLALWRTGDDHAVVSFGTFSTLVRDESGILSGSIDGKTFTLHFSGEGEGSAVTIVSGEDTVIYSSL